MHLQTMYEKSCGMIYDIIRLEKGDRSQDLAGFFEFKLVNEFFFVAGIAHIFRINLDTLSGFIEYHINPSDQKG